MTRLNDGGIAVRFPAKSREYLLQSFQTDCEVQPFFSEIRIGNFVFSDRAAHLRLLSSLRIRGALSPLSHTSSWCGAELSAVTSPFTCTSVTFTARSLPPVHQNWRLSLTFTVESNYQILSKYVVVRIMFPVGHIGHIIGHVLTYSESELVP